MEIFHIMERFILLEKSLTILYSQGTLIPIRGE